MMMMVMMILFRIKDGANLQQGYCWSVTMPGNSYWEEDPIMENVIDNAIINVGEYVSSDKESGSGTDDKYFRSFILYFISL
jgi:hypothetical protein